MRRASLSVGSREFAHGRLIAADSGITAILPPTAIPLCTMVEPGRRIRPVHVPVHQHGPRTIVARPHVEMGRHATTGMIPEDIARHWRDLRSVAVHHRDPHSGEREDLAEERDIGSLRTGLEPGDPGLSHAEQGCQVTLAQIADAPHAHDEPRDIDARRVFFTVRSLLSFHGLSLHATTDFDRLHPHTDVRPSRLRH